MVDLIKTIIIKLWPWTDQGSLVLPRTVNKSTAVIWGDTHNSQDNKSSCLEVELDTDQVQNEYKTL